MLRDDWYCEGSMWHLEVKQQMPWCYFDRVAENYQKCMARGIVKWFNEKKGFGFIVDPAVNGDVFVHFSAIATAGWKTLKEGEEVEYELDEHQKGSRAKNVVRI